MGGWLGGGGGGIKYESYWLVCMQGNGCSRTIFIDSKVLLGWSNGQRQINDWAGLMILLISIYNGRSLRSQMSKILIHWIYGYHRDKIKNGYWTSSPVIWSEIIRVILKPDKRAARVRFEVTIVISDQNCTTRSSVTTLLQLFWNRRIQSVPIFIWPDSRFVESGTRRLLHLFLYPKEKWCNIKAKMVRLKTKMTQFRTWTTRFRAKRWCDSWVNQSLKWVSKAPMLRASLVPRLWPSPPRTMGDRLHLPLSTAIIMIIILSRGLIQLAWVN